jgi:HK97 family phage prohead protease
LELIPNELSQLVEYKSIPLKLTDVDKSSRTAVIAHSAYNNIDRTKDVSRKGMFKKSWEEGIDDISFYLNHDDTQAPGKVTGVKEDSEFAYTETKMGTHTLGNDTLIMMDEGIIKKASFGYITVKSKPIEVKGQKVRELLEVKHIETSVLTKMPANPKAGVVSVVKAFDLGRLELKTLNDQEQLFLQAIIASGSKLVRQALDLADMLDPDADLYTWINYFIQQQSSWIGDAKSNLRWGRKDAPAMAELKAHAENMGRFVKNTRASDECIQQIEAELKSAQHIISLYDTAYTHDDEPDASKKGNATESEILAQLKLLQIKASLS